MASFDRPKIHCPKCNSMNITHLDDDGLSIKCGDCDYEE